MTGPEHYVKAENILASVDDYEADDPTLGSLIAEAQVHATLALAAATAGSTLGLPGVPSGEWSAVSQ